VPRIIRDPIHGNIPLKELEEIGAQDIKHESLPEA
jgi:hypothetical protein